jgi:NADH-quinone oxidoreductase subunit A
MFYFKYYILTIVFLILSLLLFIIGYLIGTIILRPKNISYEKISSYECGFDAFSDAREPFDIKFYLIAILFLIFDVEIIFFFPWIFTFKYIFYSGFFIIYLFLTILIIGYGYEWKKGCMDWD